MSTTKQYNLRPQRHWASDEKGSALIVSLVVLVALALIGMTAVSFSTSEIRIAASDRNHKQAFYAAESLELAAELLEQNIENDGFPVGTYDTSTIQIVNGNFYTNPKSQATTPSDTNRDFFMPSGAGRTNYKVGGEPAFLEGSAIAMAAGYKGRGRSRGQGGSSYLYRINSQHIGMNNTESVVRIEYRHVN
jgi:Tfp pilus assembly protein PilX